MFRRVVPFDFRGNATGLGWFEALIQASRMVNVQVVQDENDPLSLRINGVDQVPQDLCKVQFGSSRSYPDVPLATQGFYRQKERASPVALILIVLTSGLARLHRYLSPRD